MALEWFYTYFASHAFVIISVITAFLAVAVFSEILEKRYREDIKNMFLKVFALFAVAYISWAVAEIIWHITELAGTEPHLGLSEYFYTAGYLFAIGGFSYFNYSIYKKHKNTAAGMIRLFLLCLICAAGVYYITAKFIIVSSEAMTGFALFFNYFYPIASTILVITSLLVYLVFREFKQIGKPLLFFALAAGATLIGDILYTYYKINNIYGFIGVASDTVYLVSYIFSISAFYMLYKMLRFGAEKAELG